MKFDQPFFVGRNNPRFPYARHGYLPALELGEDKKSSEGDRLKKTGELPARPRIRVRGGAKL